MKQVVYALLLSLPSLAFATWDPLPTYHVIRAEDCFKRLKWNYDRTRAKCVVRNSEVKYFDGIEKADFTIPNSNMDIAADIKIRPLRNGYTIQISSRRESLNPEEIKPLIKYILENDESNGGLKSIKELYGFCNQLLADVRTIF